MVNVPRGGRLGRTPLGVASAAFDLVELLQRGLAQFLQVGERFAQILSGQLVLLLRRQRLFDARVELAQLVLAHAHTRCRVLRTHWCECRCECECE
jgi:hypothetical protein